MLPRAPSPDFTAPEFLRAHVADILAFYAPNVVDPDGGFFQHFADDGSVYDPATRHLVSSTRFVFNYANAHLMTGAGQHRDWVRHGMAYLASHHRHANGHYLWERRGGQVTDGRAMAYGHAFVMLAAAWATKVRIDGAAATLADSWDLLEKLFWDEEHGAYADERDASLQELSPYRGQNANMHAVEALIAAHEAAGERRYLDRAMHLARRFTVELAHDGQVWEHYRADWSIDWDYNSDKPDDLFKPWGFQPGHQVEWAKLLLQLDALQPTGWLLPRAVELFDAALARGWDDEHGGLVYGYRPDGGFADTHKYFWVQAEAFAAAWRLYRRTGEERYLEDYRRIWTWAWQHLVDHEHGAWFRILTREGGKVEPWKSPAGKVDYHTMGACWDVLAVG